MAESVLLALNGAPDVIECTFVESSLVPDFPFFASKVSLRKLRGTDKYLAGECTKGAFVSGAGFACFASKGAMPFGGTEGSLRPPCSLLRPLP